MAAAHRYRSGGVPDPNSSILKIKGSELLQATTELMMDVAGPYVVPYTEEDAEGVGEARIGATVGTPVGPEYAASVGSVYFNMRKVSIFGGTNEIQHNIIAKAILGL